MTKEEFAKSFSAEKPFLDNLKYYGGNDYAGMAFVKDVCENIDFLESSINWLNEKIESVEDIYRFLWCLSFKKMADDINGYKVDNSYKERISKLSSAITTDISSFVGFVNNNYQTLFEKGLRERAKEIEFFYYVLELCYGRYSKGINSEVFEFFEKEYALHILSHFDVCSKYYSKHKEGFKRLFAGLEDTRLFDDQIFLRFLINYAPHDDPFLKEQATFICERTLNSIRSKSIDEDNQEIVQTQSLIQNYNKLAILYKLKCANDYKFLTNEIKDKLDKFIRKHGVHQKIGPIDLNPAIELLKKDNAPLRFIGLTHNNEKAGEFQNALDYILYIDNKNNPLSEVLNDISRNRSKRYPYYKQDSMRINLVIRTGIIARIFNDDKLLREFANFIYNISLRVQEKYFDDLINIEKEITGEIDCFVSLTEMAKTERFETPLGRTMVHGLTMSLCSTIEKLLRNMAFKQIKNDEYFDVNKVTLSDFFKQPNLLKDLSKGLRYHLEFYLIKEVNCPKHDMERPGLNIRNKLMHGQDNAYEDSNYSTCLIMLYFLLSILDDLLIITLPE